jgi:RimJ/RimL family protein N-acetyltransferase
MYFNSSGQRVGKPVPDRTISKRPTGETLIGKTCHLELLHRNHILDLWAAYSIDKEHKNFTYLPYGPFDDITHFEVWVKSVVGKSDPVFYAIIDSNTKKAVGVSSYLRIYPELGSIEIGHLHFSPLMQRTIISSETIILMARYAFSLGNRTLVWKCHSLNVPSLAAAKRYGFQYESFFLNHTLMKNQNRNTAWLSIIKEEWPAVDEVYTKWLNLALAGNHQSLSAMMAELKENRGKLFQATN